MMAIDPFNLQALVEHWTGTVYPQLFLQTTVEIARLHHSIGLYTLALSSPKWKPADGAIIAAMLGDLYRIAGVHGKASEMFRLAAKLDPKRRQLYVKRC